MRIVPLAVFVVFVVFARAPVIAAQELTVERLATCQVSWLDAKDDAVRIKKFGDMLMGGYEQKNRDPFFVPKAKALVAGLPVLRLFPETMGMGVGFSVVVGANFATTKSGLEKAIGKSLGTCESGEGMRHCELKIGPKRSLILMSDEAGKSKETLFGCFYYYEK